LQVKDKNSGAKDISVSRFKIRVSLFDAVYGGFYSSIQMERIKQCFRVVVISKAEWLSLDDIHHLIFPSRAQRITIKNPDYTTFGYNISSSSSLSYIRPQYGLDSCVKGYMYVTTPLGMADSVLSVQ
jgi:hypothetical protein